MTTIPQLPAGSRIQQQGDGPRSVHDRLVGTVTRHVGEFPRFWSQPRPSARQALDYTRRGEWTTEEDGPARRWRLAFTYVLTIPLTALGAFLEWMGAEPARVATTVPLLALLLTALNEAPVLGLLIPDPLTLTHWPPLSWLPGKE